MLEQAWKWKSELKPLYYFFTSSKGEKNAQNRFTILTSSKDEKNARNHFIVFNELERREECS